MGDTINGDPARRANRSRTAGMLPSWANFHNFGVQSTVRGAFKKKFDPSKELYVKDVEM